MMASNNLFLHFLVYETLLLSSDLLEDEEVLKAVKQLKNIAVDVETKFANIHKAELKILSLKQHYLQVLKSYT